MNYFSAFCQNPARNTIFSICSKWKQTLYELTILVGKVFSERIEYRRKEDGFPHIPLPLQRCLDKTCSPKSYGTEGQ